MKQNGWTVKWPSGIYYIYILCNIFTEKDYLRAFKSISLTSMLNETRKVSFNTNVKYFVHK